MREKNIVNYKNLAPSKEPFLKVLLKNGSEKTVKKTSLCWLFNEKMSKFQ